MKTLAEDCSATPWVFCGYTHASQKIVMLSVLALVVSCSTISPDENFKQIIRKGIGHSIADETRLIYFEF